MQGSPWRTGPTFFVMRVECVLGAYLPVVRSYGIPFLEPLATLQGGGANTGGGVWMFLGDNNK